MTSNYLKAGLSIKWVHFAPTELSTHIIDIQLDKLWTHSHVPIPVVSVSGTRRLGYHCMKREQTQHSLLPFVCILYSRDLAIKTVVLTQLPRHQTRVFWFHMHGVGLENSLKLIKFICLFVFFFVTLEIRFKVLLVVMAGFMST